MSLFFARRLAGVALMAFAVGACSPQSSVAAAPVADAPAAAQVAAPEKNNPPVVGTLNGRALPDFATLVEQVGPAVVNISVVEKARRVGACQAHYLPNTPVVWGPFPGAGRELLDTILRRS